MNHNDDFDNVTHLDNDIFFSKAYIKYFISLFNFTLQRFKF